MKYVLLNNKKYKLNIMNTFYTKLKGLMFKKDNIEECYMFYNTNSIHTFFMYQNIDVLFLSKDFKVIKKYSNLRNNKIILPIKSAYYTLELPINTINLINIGDFIDFI